MDKTFAAIYAVCRTGKSPDYHSITHKPHVGSIKEQANIAKTYVTKLKNLIDRLRR